MNRHIYLLTASLCALGCGGDVAQSGSRLGSEGASCQKTNDCESPLQCMNLVCTAPGSSGGDAGSTTDSGTSDVTEPPDAVDLPDYGPIPDLPQRTEDAKGVLADVLPSDAEADDVPAITPDTTGLPDGAQNPVSDCDGVGIQSEWFGSFTGEVEYDVPFEIPGAPPDGKLPVVGDLSFEIQCIQQKLIVIGDMDGTALAEYPFTLELQGSFNPETGVLTAKMVNGKVVLFDFVTVKFKGDLVGELVAPGQLEGTWDGESDGTIPDLPGTATGAGEWYATSI